MKRLLMVGLLGMVGSGHASDHLSTEHILHIGVAAAPVVVPAWADRSCQGLNEGEIREGARRAYMIGIGMGLVNFIYLVRVDPQDAVGPALGLVAGLYVLAAGTLMNKNADGLGLTDYRRQALINRFPAETSKLTLMGNKEVNETYEYHRPQLER